MRTGFTAGGRGRVQQYYQASNPDPITVKAGEAVTLGRRDAEWPGWIWCTDVRGRGGWTPAGWLDVQGNMAIVLRDYTACELTVAVGEELTLHALEGGWYWATNARGEAGWVPASCVAPA